jgi:hypothetical protein
VRPLVRPQIDSSGSRREDDAELSNEEVQREAGRRQRDRQRQPRTRHRELHDPVHLRELADDGQHRLPRAHQDSGGTVEERHQERAAGLFAGQHRRVLPGDGQGGHDGPVYVLGQTGHVSGREGQDKLCRLADRRLTTPLDVVNAS